MRCDSKINTCFFSFLLHNFWDRRLVLTADLSKLSTRVFSFLEFTLSLSGSTLGLLWRMYELPASLLQRFGAVIKIRATGRQAPQSRDSWPESPDPGLLSQDSRKMGGVTLAGETSEKTRDFISLLTPCNVLPNHYALYFKPIQNNIECKL